MSGTAKPWIWAALAGGGLALTWVSGAAGVGVSLVGYFLALFATMARNRTLTRAATAVAAGFHAGALYLASGSAWLAAGAFVVDVIILPNGLVVRRLLPVISFMPALAVVLGSASVAASWPTGWWGLALLPHVGFAAMLAYSFLTSPKDKTPSLQPGQPMPELRLPRADGGGLFDLAAERGRFVLLCFLRGDWCPICHVMMRIFRREAPRLARMGVKLVMISPSGGPSFDAFARDMGLDYLVLTDERAVEARRLGLLQEKQHQGEDVPQPISLLIDAQGVVRYVSQPHDFSTFADESRLMRLLETASA